MEVKIDLQAVSTLRPQCCTVYIGFHRVVVYLLSAELSRGKCRLSGCLLSQ